MIIALIALAVTAAYLATGWRLAIRNLPRAWKHARWYWFDDRSRIRGSVRKQTTAMLLFWPFVLLFARAIPAAWHCGQGVLNRTIDRHDPERSLPPMADLRAVAKMNAAMQADENRPGEWTL